MEKYTHSGRIIRILEMLASGKYITTDLLFEKFERQVSKRTLQRDLNEIADILPLDRIKLSYNENSWRLPNYYHNILKPIIQKNEILAFHYLKSFIKSFKNTSLNKSLNKLSNTLENLVPGNIILHTDIINGNMIYDQSLGTIDYSKQNDIINDIIEHMSLSNWIDIIYQSDNSDSQQTITVFAQRIYHYNGTLYLLANQKDSSPLKTFSIHYIKSLIKSPIQDNSRPIFSEEEFKHNRFAVYEGTPEKVEFIVSKDVKKYFINRDWHTSQKIILNDDGTLLIEMFVPIVPDFISWIFSWSDEIIVKSPKKLIGQIKYQCKKMTEQYNNLDEGM